MPGKTKQRGTTKSGDRRGARGQHDPAEVLERVALLTAVNNLMAQTAFLTVERLRISSEVVDEKITDEFGAQLFARCEQLCAASDAAILELLDAAGADDEGAGVVRDLVALRRQFQDRAQRPLEQRRLVESLERMYR